jgi:hypothetical protein
MMALPKVEIVEPFAGRKQLRDGCLLLRSRGAID